MQIIIYSINFYRRKQQQNKNYPFLNTKSGPFHYTENKQTKSLLFPMSSSLHPAFTKLDKAAMKTHKHYTDLEDLLDARI